MSLMKQVSKYFLVMLFTLFLIMCSDDDNPSEGPIQDERLVGNWTLIKITIPLMNMELTPEEAGLMITGVVRADGTMEITTIDSTGTLVESGTWSTNNEKLTLSTDEQSVVMEYSVNGDIISVNNPLEIEPGVEVPAILDFRKD